MKKFIYLFYIIALVPAFSAAGEFYDFDKAANEAKSDQKDIVVLLHGSDWNRQGEAFRKGAWGSLVSGRGSSLPVFVALDLKEGFSDAERKAFFETNKGFFGKISMERLHNFPVLVYCDYQGYPIARVMGVNPKMKERDLMTLLGNCASQRKKRDRDWESARKKSGRSKAIALGDGLAELDDGMAEFYKSKLSEIKKLDPEDPDGNLLRFQFDAGKIYAKQIGPLLKEEQFKEALERVDELLEMDLLLPDQKLQISAFEYGIYKKMKRDDDAETVLMKLIRKAPNSETAQAAKQLLYVSKRKEQVEKLKQSVVAAKKDGNKDQFRSSGKKLLALMTDQDKPEKAGVPRIESSDLLLSGEAFLTTSSSAYDTPWSHYLVLTDQYRGALHTGREKRPWACVELRKQASISKVVVVNRPSEKYASRVVPLKVSTSMDGKKWKTVFASEQLLDYWEITLDHERARFIKVERDNDVSDYFNLSNILVYGRP